MAAGADGPGWWYEPAAGTVHVILPATAIHRSVEVVVAGGGIDLLTRGR
jgi:hypothetical protein